MATRGRQSLRRQEPRRCSNHRDGTATDTATLQERWYEIAAYIHGRGTMVVGPMSYGSVRNIYHRRVQGPLWQHTYTQPVRSKVEEVWIDPRWDGTDFSG